MLLPEEGQGHTQLVVKRLKRVEVDPKFMAARSCDIAVTVEGSSFIPETSTPVMPMAGRHGGRSVMAGHTGSAVRKHLV